MHRTPETLHDMISQDECARAFYVCNSDRGNNQMITTIDSAERLLDKNGYYITRRQIISFFKRLGEMGFGDFIAGRHQSPSRFAWQVGLTHFIRQAGKHYEPDEPQEPENEEEETENNESYASHGSLSGFPLHKKTIMQIVAIAGDGHLRDDTICQAEVRDYFYDSPTGTLKRHAEFCLTNDFPSNERIIQEIAVECARRIGFDIEYGSYERAQNSYGGILEHKHDAAIVLSVRVSDTDVSFDELEDSLVNLVDDGRIARGSSLLLENKGEVWS